MNVILEESYYTVIHTYKKYKAMLLSGKVFNINLKPKWFNIESEKKKYGVCYCVKYRPIGLIERILLRGWWNDGGIWTEDGVFNDGIL